MRREINLEARLNDRRTDRIMTAPGAQRRDTALIVAAGKAERIALERGVMQRRFGDVGHSAFSRSVAWPALSFSVISRMMKRAVIGVPS
jgi:hypothetical protein